MTIERANPFGATHYYIVKDEPSKEETDMAVIHLALLWKWPAFLKDWQAVEAEVRSTGYATSDGLDQWKVALSYEEQGSSLALRLQSTLYGPSVLIGEATSPDEIPIVLRKSNRPKHEVMAEFAALVDRIGISQKSAIKPYSTWLTHFELYKIHTLDGTKPYTLAKRELDLKGPIGYEHSNHGHLDSRRGSIRKSFLVFNEMFVDGTQIRQK